MFGKYSTSRLAQGLQELKIQKMQTRIDLGIRIHLHVGKTVNFFQNPHSVENTRACSENLAQESRTKRSRDQNTHIRVESMRNYFQNLKALKERSNILALKRRSRIKSG